MHRSRSRGERVGRRVLHDSGAGMHGEVMNGVHGVTSHALRRMCRAGTVADRCVFGWGVCVRVSGASRFRPREGTSHTTPPTTSGATNEMHRTIRIKTAPFVSFTRRIRPFHPPPRRSTRVSKGTTRARDDGERWPAAAGEFSFWCLVLPGGDCNGKNCECRAAGWLTARRRRRFDFVGCRRQGKLVFVGSYGGGVWRSMRGLVRSRGVVAVVASRFLRRHPALLPSF